MKEMLVKNNAHTSRTDTGTLVMEQEIGVRGGVP